MQTKKNEKPLELYTKINKKWQGKIKNIL